MKFLFKTKVEGKPLAQQDLTDEEVAVITAAISACMQTEAPSAGLRISLIKRLPDTATLWRRASVPVQM